MYKVEGYFLTKQSTKCASYKDTRIGTGKSNCKMLMPEFHGYTIGITNIHTQTHKPTQLYIRIYKFM